MYKQIGNAVPVLLAEHLAKYVKEKLSSPFKEENHLLQTTKKEGQINLNSFV